MKKAIVLGGTSPHIKLINKLKERGYFVILIDCLDNSPGVEFADRHIQESTLDKEKVLEIALEEKVDLVISACIDQANSVCCYVAERLNLPKPYNYETALNVTDKGLMKKIMVDNHIPTSQYVVVDNVVDIDWDKIVFPAVVKPVDCNSSKGVHRVDNKEETIRYTKDAIEFSRTHQAIIEGFNEGYEIQVDCFATMNGAELLLTREKKKIVGNSNEMVLQSTGSIIPARLNEELKEQAKEIAKKIAEAFGLKNTPFFYQAIVTTEGISVLEFAPRIGGGLSHYLLKYIAEYDAVEAAIDSFIGNVVDVETKELNKCYSTNLLYMNSGVFGKIEGLEILKKEGLIKEYFQMKKPGTYIDSDMRSGNRVGAFIVEADTYEKLEQVELDVYKKIKVLNSDGKDVLKRDFM